MGSFSWLSNADSVAIDNGISVGPVIKCDSHALTLQATTRNPFAGRMYVKGESSNVDCSVNYTGNASVDIEISVPLTACNVRRVRIPGGAFEYTTTLVVSFHRMFETKVDRAYRVHCVFTQVNNTFTASPIEVSMIATTESLSQTASVAQCEYEIRRGSVDGQLLQFATIGEPVVHLWKCQTAGMRILVRDCYVDDGGGNKVATIDSQGCAVDRFLIQTPTYVAPDYTVVYTEAHVFKYADRPTVLFACQIQFCDASDSACRDTTPPTCDGVKGPTAGPISSNYTGPVQNITGHTSPASINFTISPLVVTSGVGNITGVTGLINATSSNASAAAELSSTTVTINSTSTGQSNATTGSTVTTETGQFNATSSSIGSIVTTIPTAPYYPGYAPNETSSPTIGPNSTILETAVFNATAPFPTPALMILLHQKAYTSPTVTGHNVTRRIRRAPTDADGELDGGLWDVVSNELTVMDLEQELKHAGDTTAAKEYLSHRMNDSNEAEIMDHATADSIYYPDDKLDHPYSGCSVSYQIAVIISILASTVIITATAGLAVYCNVKHGRKHG